MEQRRRLVTLLALSILIPALVLANDPAQSTPGQTGQYTPPGANTVGAGGGNVTEVNISADLSTSKWQGYWGNISGSLRLGDGADVFYDWTGIDFTAVYASPSDNVEWTSVTGISSDADKADKDTAYGFTSADADSINNTMSGSACNAGTEISSAAGVTPYDNTGNPGSWETCLADDGTAPLAGTVFGTDIVMEGATAFNGLSVQFQLMVPAQTGGTDYYFYLEI